MSKKAPPFGKLTLNWKRLLIQGSITLVLGILMALASVANPNAIILSARGFSWLPVSGMLLFILGAIGCMEAFFAKVQREVLQNLHVGVLEMVVGGLTVLSISGDVSRLSIMISAFLMIKGIIRIALVNKLDLPHMLSTAVGGIISLASGIMIFMQWVEEGWIISLCLNIEIAFRGWAVISFALWVKEKKRDLKNPPLSE